MKSTGEKFPIINSCDEDAITHDYREGCIYDMCGIKEDIVYSCVAPTICEQCCNHLIAGLKESECK